MPDPVWFNLPCRPQLRMDRRSPGTSSVQKIAYPEAVLFVMRARGSTLPNHEVSGRTGLWIISRSALEEGRRHRSWLEALVEMVLPAIMNEVSGQ